MIGVCEYCGLKSPLDRHHINKNRSNNDSSNLVMLCKWCHKEADGYQSHRPLPFSEVRKQYVTSFPRIDYPDDYDHSADLRAAWLRNHRP